MASHSNGSTRRGFLGVATVGVGAAIGGVVAVPARGLRAGIRGSGGDVPARDPRPGPTGSRRSRGSTPTPAPYVEDPAQPLVSSGLAYVHHTGHPNHDWLAPDAMFVVFSNRCTHVGCPAQATGVGIRMPVPREPVRPAGRADRRPGGASARPLPVGDPRRRPPVAHRTLERPDRGRKVQYFPVKAPGQPLEGQLAMGDIRPPLPAGHLPARTGTGGSLRTRPVGDPGQLERVTAQRAAVARETVAGTLVGLADRHRHGTRSGRKTGGRRM